jgi:hypothetical protein
MYNKLSMIQGLLESIESILSHLQLRKCSNIDLADFLTEDFDEAFVMSPNNYDIICGEVGKVRSLVDKCIKDCDTGTVLYQTI